MAHPLFPDPRETARRVAAEHVARTFTGKSAKAQGREADRLAAELVPVCEAVAEGLTPLMERLAGADGDGGIGARLRAIHDADVARAALLWAHVNGSGSGGPVAPEMR